MDKEGGRGKEIDNIKESGIGSNGRGRGRVQSIGYWTEGYSPIGFLGYLYLNVYIIPTQYISITYFDIDS